MGYEPKLKSSDESPDSRPGFCLASGSCERGCRLTCQDLADLLQMVEVVAGDELREVANGHSTTLGVNGVALPLLGSESIQHAQIVLAK